MYNTTGRYTIVPKQKIMFYFGFGRDLPAVTNIIIYSVDDRVTLAGAYIVGVLYYMYYINQITPNRPPFHQSVVILFAGIRV